MDSSRFGCSWLKDLGFTEENWSLRKGSMEDLFAVSYVEKECFPPLEAATEESFRERLQSYGNHFLLLYKGDQLISFVDGFCTKEENLTDLMYEDASLHDEEGSWQMIFGVNTVPAYQRRGIASKMLEEFIRMAKEEGREGLVLTCKKEKIPFYARLGFSLEGLSDSVHGNVEWYQMRLRF